MRARNTLVASLFALSVAFPALASAQTIVATLSLFSALLNALIAILITLAIVVFFWGLIKYLLSSGATEEAHKGIHQMIWGIVAIFVMVSIWGIIGLLQRTFQVENNRALIPDSVRFQFRN